MEAHRVLGCNEVEPPLRLALKLECLGQLRVRGAGGARLEDRVELIVDTGVARLFPLEFFHLLGYRKRRQDGATLVVTRRAFDFEGPEKIRM